MRARRAAVGLPVTAVAAGLLLSGCGTKHLGPGVAGPTWRLTSVTDAQGTLPVSGVGATVLLSDASARWSDGVNFCSAELTPTDQGFRLGAGTCSAVGFAGSSQSAQARAIQGMQVVLADDQVIGTRLAGGTQLTLTANGTTLTFTTGG